jgi:hypothetical protein
MSSGKPSVYSFLIILSAILFHACGYRLVGQATGLPDEIAKVSVEVFKNKTYEPNLESHVTRGILEAITIDGRLKVVPSDEADAVITGEITSYSTIATAYDTNRTATSYKNSLSVKFEVADRHGMNIQYNGNVSTTGNYRTTSSLQSIEASRLNSLVAIGKSVGTSITSTLLNRFSLEPLLYGDTYGLTMADKNRLKHLYSWAPAGKEIFGNISGLTKNARSEIVTLYLTRTAPGNLVPKKLLYSLVDYSQKLGKDIALLINRAGNVTRVIVDSDTVPDFHRLEIGKKRLSGMMLVRSNFSGRKLTKADLKNLQTRRLDMVITVNKRKEKTDESRDGLEIRLAHLTGDENEPFIVYGPEPYNNAEKIYLGFVEKEAGAFNTSVYGNTKELSQKHIDLARSLYTEKALQDDSTEIPESGLKEKPEKETEDGEPVTEPPPKRRSVPAGRIVTDTLMEDLVEISKTIKRTVGVLVNSRGVVTDVIVNRKRQASIPEDRSRKSKDLKGFRFIYASGNSGAITGNDLALLDKHRLDFICVAAPKNRGEPKVSLAFLTKDEGGPYAIYGPASTKRTDKLMSKLKADRGKEPSIRKPADKKLLEYLAQLSGELNREVGILVTRSGRVTHVIVGDEKNISIPSLPRTRTGLMKLNGYSFIRSGFGDMGITGDDLEALINTRFDNVIVAGVTENRTLGSLSLAQLTTSNPESPFAIYGPGKYEDILEAYQKTADEIHLPPIGLSLKGITFGLEEREKILLQGYYFSSIPKGTIGGEELLMPRKIGPKEFVSEKLLADMARVSRILKRETGVMINRDGEIKAVVVGDEMQIPYPPPSTRMVGKKKLSGLRFIHTQLEKGGIAESGDRYDLQRHRFDMMAVATVETDGKVGRIGIASLTGNKDKPVAFHDPISLSEANNIYADFIDSVKDEPEVTPLYGDSAGISNDDLENLKNLYFEKIDTAKPLEGRLLSTTSSLLNSIEREIGIIFDRDGRVTHILLGGRTEEEPDITVTAPTDPFTGKETIFDPDAIKKPKRTHLWRKAEKGFTVPALPYRRIGKLKLNGFTLIHFSPDKSSVSKNDLAELAFQRLDAVITVEVKPSGTPRGVYGKSSLAYLTDNRKKPFYIARPSIPDKIIGRYRDFIRRQAK